MMVTPAAIVSVKEGVGWPAAWYVWSGLFFRWIHVVAGILWIGHLYFFNWVNGPFAATMDGETKKKVVPQLMPRALFWFRWGAAWTWFSGVFLLLLVFYHGGALFENPSRTWTGPGAVGGPIRARTPPASGGP